MNHLAVHKKEQRHGQGLLLMMPEIGIAALGSTFVVAVSMYQWVQTRSKEPKGTDTENAE